MPWNKNAFPLTPHNAYIQRMSRFSCFFSTQLFYDLIKIKIIIKFCSSIVKKTNCLAKDWFTKICLLKSEQQSLSWFVTSVISCILWYYHWACIKNSLTKAMHVNMYMHTFRICCGCNRWLRASDKTIMYTKQYYILFFNENH